MDEPGLGHLLATLVGDDPDRAEHVPGTSSPSPSCLPTSRVRSAVLRENWSDAERGHLCGCTWCRRNESLVRAQSWHPSFVQLFRQARALPQPETEDTTYHLQKDGCRRCVRVSALFGADRLLVRLVSDLRAGMASAVNRLGNALATGAVASVALSALPNGTSRHSFDNGQHALVVASTDPTRIRLDIPPGPDPRPRLFRVLVGDTRIVHDTLLIPRPNEGTQQTEFLLPAVPADRVAVALYEVDPTLLNRDDTSLLQSAFQSAAKLDPLCVPSWQAWAKESLTRPDLDAGIRPMLEGMARAEVGKHRA